MTDQTQYTLANIVRAFIEWHDFLSEGTIIPKPLNEYSWNRFVKERSGYGFIKTIELQYSINILNPTWKQIERLLELL
jgi:hypothetical protein